MATKTQQPHEEGVLIPQIRKERMMVTLVGQTELISHRFSDEAKDAMTGAQEGKAKLKKEARNPRKEFMASLYPMPGSEGGEYGIPAVAFKKAIVTAGGRFADEHKTVLNGVLNIVGDMVLIKDPTDDTPAQPHMREDLVRIGPSRTANVSYRGGFRCWKVDVLVEYASNLISREQVLNLFNIAGFSVGVGDWRVEKSGTFGQFSIAKAAPVV